MLTDKWIEVPPLDLAELDLEFNALVRRALKFSFAQSTYEKFLLRYLRYAATRYGLKDVKIFIDSTLKDPIYAFTTGNNIVFSQKLFTKHEPEHLFKALDFIEHELAHLFEQKNFPSTYQKFTNETGKRPCYNYALAFDFLKQIFKRSNLENTILTLRQLTYANAENEIYARGAAVSQMQVLCDSMLKIISENKSYKTAENEQNYLQCEQLLQKFKQQEGVIDRKTQVFLQSENYKNLLISWNKFVDDFTHQRVEISAFTGRPLKNFINAHLSDLNDLLGVEYLYSQENIDKMFAYYINKNECGYYKLAYKLTELVLNKNSKSQLEAIYEKLQNNTPTMRRKLHNYAIKSARKSKLIPEEELISLYSRYEPERERK